MAKVSSVLKNKNFFFLWLGQIISQLGDRLDQMALIAFVYSRAPGSAVEIAKILTFTIIPVFLIGPIAGVYVDRWDRRRTMYTCDFLRAVLVFTIPFFLFYIRHLAPIYVIIFLVFCIGRFFIPAKFSLIPELVKKDELLLANSLVNITGMLAAIVGFGIGGVIVELIGAKNGFYLDSLSFFISGALIFFIATKTAKAIKADALRDMALVGRELVEKIRKSVWLEIREGIAYFIRQRETRFAAAVMFLLFSALGSVYVVLIVFVQSTLKSATLDLGLLIMFLGIGLFLGSMFYGRFGSRLSHYKTIFSSLILSGIILVVFATLLHRYPYFYVAAALSFIFGISVSPIMTACNTLIHNTSDNQMMGKIFSSLEIVMHLGFIIFMFISSFLSNRISSVSILVAVGIVFSILGVINLIYQRKIPWLN